MAGVDLSNAELVGIIIETLLYGIFLVLFPLAIHVLLYRRESSSFGSISAFNKTVILVAGSLFLSITAHWIIDILRLWDAFITFRDAKGGPTAYYANLSNPKNIVKTALFVFQIIAGDSIIVYRLFIVWSRTRWVVIFPIFSIIGLLICGIGITYEFTRIGDGSIFAEAAQRWITSVFSFTLATNLYSTTMITYRIWRSDISSKRVGGSSLRPVMQIVIESAAIYTVCSVFAFATYLSGSNIQYPAIDLTSTVIGIVLCLLVVRVSFFGRSRGGTSSGNQRSRSMYPEHPNIQTHHSAHGYPLVPLAVNITKHVDVDDAYVSKQDDGQQYDGQQSHTSAEETTSKTVVAV